jgi:hypothetical protein
MLQLIFGVYMKNLFYFLIFALASSLTHSEEILSTWTDGKVITTFKSDSEWENAQARIGYTATGRYIMIGLVPRDHDEECRINLVEDIPKKYVFFVNNQAIQGKVECAKFVDSGDRLYFIYPITTPGEEFVQRAFRTSNYVSIKHILRDFKLSAEGFIAEWDGGSEKAL